MTEKPKPLNISFSWTQPYSTWNKSPLENLHFSHEEKMEIELIAMDLLEEDVDLTVEPAQAMLAGIGIQCK